MDSFKRIINGVGRRESTAETKKPITIGVPRLKQEWNLWTISAFAVLPLSSWEVVISLLATALRNGGPSAVVFGSIFISLIFFSIYASLAELASMFPSAGAEYIWTAHFAPQKYRAFTSYVQGWLTLACWQFCIPALTNVMAEQIQATIKLASPSYTTANWHTGLIMMAIVTLCYLIATVGRRTLVPLITLAAIFHFCLCFVVIILLLARGQRASSASVWLDTKSTGAWSSHALGFCVGFVNVAFPLVGADTCAHFAEETVDARKNIPRAMVFSIVTNGVMMFAFILVAIYCVTDLDQVVADTKANPFLIIALQSHISLIPAVILQSLIQVPLFGAIAGMLASTGRLTWAFARDGAFGASDYFAQIDIKYRMPLRAVFINYVITILICAVVIGSPVAFTALTSFVALIAIISYLLPIGLLLRCRLRKGCMINYGPWTLGRLGIPLNITALFFGCACIIFIPFPFGEPVTWSNMNYAAPVLFVLLSAATGHWFLYGRKHFRGPIVMNAYQSYTGDNKETFMVMSRDLWLETDSSPTSSTA